MALGSILTTLGVGAAGNLETLLLRQGRSIAGIFPNVLIEERHTDEIEITQHPVEQGSPVSDHAFKRPMRLVMRVGWSNSNVLLNYVKGAGDIKDVYEQLLALQRTFKPFSVTTGKRNYSNMMLQTITVITNKETENSLVADLEFEEVILVQTLTSTALLPPVAQQADPSKTASPANNGTQQAQSIGLFSNPFGS